MVRDRVYRTYSERDRLELAANLFALELLAPVQRVRERVRSDPGWTVMGLAAYFGLSRTAMLNQLAAALLGGPEPEVEEPASEELPPLDDSQAAAVRVAGPALVLAGPGAGKTRVLVDRFEHLVKQGADPRRILALTFANKAAEEMRERLARRLPDHGLTIQVSTFHSLGLELLRAYGKQLGLQPSLKLLTEVDAFVFLRSRLTELPLGSFEELYYPARHLGLLQGLISRAKDELVGPDEFARLVQAWQETLAAEALPDDPEAAQALADQRTEAAKCADVAAVYAVYQQWLREEGYLDFGDLVMESARLFEVPGVGETIRSEYDHVLVDEYQDTNYAQGRLVQSLDGGRGIVWAVGDPRQSIYGFRGASPINLRHFTTDYPGATVVPLEWNYRSVEEVVRAGQAVPIPLSGRGGADCGMLPVPGLRAFRGKTDAPTPVVEVMVAPTGPDELAAIADRVKALLRERSPQEVAVLCRTRARAGKVSEALEQRGISTNWGGALVERAAFKDVLGVLLLAAGDLRGLVRVSAMPEHRLHEGDLRLLLKAGAARGASAHAALYAAAAGEVEGLSEVGQRQAESLKRLAGRLGHQPTPWHALAAYLFEEADWLRRLVRSDAAAARRCLATLGQVADLMREFSQRMELAGGQDLAAFIQFVQSSLESGVLGDAGNSLPVVNAVTVTTVHQSKGLEWNVVLLPCLAEGQFPLKDRPEGLRLPPGLVHGEDEADHKVDEACLFYVGVTRARDRLVLTRASQYGRLKPPESSLLAALTAGLAGTGSLQETVLPAGSLPDEESTEATGLGWSFAGEIPHRALETYETCPRRFLYEWVYRLTEEDRGYRDFHRVVYAVLDWAAEQAALGEPPDSGTVRAELDVRWAECGPKEHRLEPLYRRWAEQLVERLTGRLKPRVRIRYRQQVPIRVGRHTVLMTVDELEEGPEPTVRRHRFAKRGKTPPKDPLLKVLGLAQVGSPGSPPPKVQLHYALEATDEEATPSARVRKNWIEKMEKHIGSIEAGEFPPDPSIKQCPNCRFYLICPSETG